MTLNEINCKGTVVDGSYYSGKLDLSVIVDNESTITKLSRDEAIESKLFENNDKIQWRQELLPENSLVNQAIVECFKCIKESKINNDGAKADSITLVLLMLLKISLLYDQEDNQLETMEPLLNICDEYHSKAVEVPGVDCELELCEAWKRIVDKLEPVLNYHYTLNPSGNSNKNSESITPENSEIQITEHSLPSSGYDQLPRPKPQASESKAAIRLLAYWEKNIIPKIIEFVKSTYKPWEMEFYFEQLRFPLRNGDQRKALDEALIMCEKKMPAGAVVPDDSYDWSAKMPDESIVGSWFLVKLPELKATFGNEEIVVMLKAIDLENKIGYVEYIDIGSMRYNMWVPLKYMYDLPMPLNIPAVCTEFKKLKQTYEDKLLMTSAFYAKKIIINHFTKKGSIGRVLSDPTDKVLRVKDIITWIIGNEYARQPVSGVRTVYGGIHDDTIGEQLETYSKKDLTRNDLTEIAQLCARNLLIQEAKNEQLTKTNEILIEHELENMIKSGNTQAVEHLFDWIKDQWGVLTRNLNKVDIDICKEYQRYAGLSDSSKVTPEGQEIIECRDNSVLIPLHRLFPKEVTDRLNVGMVVSFDRHTSFMCTTAALKFYSDERGANLIGEINQASNPGSQIRPLLFNHGKVWCIFDAGTSAILPMHMQTNVTNSLKCTITLVPYEWTTCCVLTGNICNSLFKSHKEENEEFESKIFGGLISQLTKFYREAGAPASLNIYILQILNKLIQNYRTLHMKSPKNSVSEDPDNYDDEIQKHFDRIQVDKSFIEALISEADILKGDQAELTGAQTLFSRYLQTQVELIVGTLLPTARGEKIKSIQDIIQIPKWIECVVIAAQILAYLDSPKNLLSNDIEQQCFDQTRISSQWERVIIISKLPQEMTREEIKTQVLEL
jgi:other hect domain ubiquitin protein ligase E3